MNPQEQFVLESLTQKLIIVVMEKHNLTMIEAMDKVYTSNWYEKILDTETKLLYQSPLYNYEYLKKEL